MLDRARFGSASTLRCGPVSETPPRSGGPGTSRTCVRPSPGPPGLPGGRPSGSTGRGRGSLRRGGASPYGYGVNDGCGYPGGAKNAVVGGGYAACRPASGGGGRYPSRGVNVGWGRPAAGGTAEREGAAARGPSSRGASPRPLLACRPSARCLSSLRLSSLRLLSRCLPSSRLSPGRPSWRPRRPPPPPYGDSPWECRGAPAGAPRGVNVGCGPCWYGPSADRGSRRGRPLPSPPGKSSGGGSGAALALSSGASRSRSRLSQPLPDPPRDRRRREHPDCRADNDQRVHGTASRVSRCRDRIRGGRGLAGRLRGRDA